jgi:pimeloyl-ACP methyl ester carboxylesterase
MVDPDAREGRRGEARGDRVEIPPLGLPATCAVPAQVRGTIMFAHGSGSSRLSPRNKAVAAALGEARFATLLFDLLTEDEAADRRNVFAIELLARRLLMATDWVRGDELLGALPIGYFGASTGAAAALVADADAPTRIAAIVSRGGRPDLAGTALSRVSCPTLLIV